MLLKPDRQSHSPTPQPQTQESPPTTPTNPITTGSAIEVPDIDYSKHKILLAVI
ncbi:MULTISPECIES: hypothetical protein [unclassified Microcoleus]|uniref:hypothetical protein n=1 Tax=unclassified Microcoleus TaxID=2642155 RepID=UPI002FD4B4CE